MSQSSSNRDLGKGKRRRKRNLKGVPCSNDPIFYSHHANIDRLWQKLHPMPINTLWLMQQFMFPDETGALQKQPVSNFVNTQSLGYQYDNEASCFRVPPASLHVEVMTQQEPAAPVTYPNLVARAPGVALKPITTSIDIEIPRIKATSLMAFRGKSQGRAARSSTLGSEAAAAVTSRRIYRKEGWRPPHANMSLPSTSLARSANMT